jgi:hypothetical protein
MKGLLHLCGENAPMLGRPPFLKGARLADVVDLSGFGQSSGRFGVLSSRIPAGCFAPLISSHGATRD